MKFCISFQISTSCNYFPKHSYLVHTYNVIVPLVVKLNCVFIIFSFKNSFTLLCWFFLTEILLTCNNVHDKNILYKNGIIMITQSMWLFSLCPLIMREKNIPPAVTKRKKKPHKNHIFLIIISVLNVLIKKIPAILLKQ